MLNKTPVRGQEGAMSGRGLGQDSEATTRRVKAGRPRAGLGPHGPPTSDRSCKAAAHSHGTGSGQHLCVPRFVLARVVDGESAGLSSPPLSSARLQGTPYLIDASEEGEELAEQRSTHACDMYKGALGEGVRRWEGEAAHPHPGLAPSSTGRDSFIPRPSATSLPRGMPLPRAQVSPMTFATKVLRVRYSFSTTPRKMVFISGMPDPGECTVSGE